MSSFSERGHLITSVLKGGFTNKFYNINTKRFFILEKNMTVYTQQSSNVCGVSNHRWLKVFKITIQHLLDF